MDGTPFRGRLLKVKVSCQKKKRRGDRDRKKGGGKGNKGKDDGRSEFSKSFANIFGGLGVQINGGQKAKLEDPAMGMVETSKQTAPNPNSFCICCFFDF